MFVSKKVLLFKSKRNGYLLFCGNSNSFYQIEEENVPAIQNMIDSGDCSHLPDALKKEFIKSGVILSEDDDVFFNRLKFSSYLTRFSKNSLRLTIAPTMACNFKCVYCYEGSRVKEAVMSEEVVQGIIDYVKKSGCQSLHITWYGGEPLCAWNKILDINKRIEELNLKEFTQNIVTNGSLLDEEKINFMYEKKFKTIQITLDGNEENHNKNRPMKNGQNSFQTIMSKLDLLYSIYKKTGTHLQVNIRVNISEENLTSFPEVYKIINDKYSGYFYTYPAFVTKSADNDCMTSTCLTFEKEAEYILKLSKVDKINTYTLYPQRNKIVGCGAQLLNTYVIDPSGDMFKCWEDIGKTERSVGNVLTGQKDKCNINYEFIMASTAFENELCKDCLFMYSCMGGCAYFRNMNKKANKVINPTCALIKNNPEEFLETYFELQKNEIEVCE